MHLRRQADLGTISTVGRSGAGQRLRRENETGLGQHLELVAPGGKLFEMMPLGWHRPTLSEPRGYKPEPTGSRHEGAWVRSPSDLPAALLHQIASCSIPAQCAVQAQGATAVSINDQAERDHRGSHGYQGTKTNRDLARIGDEQDQSAGNEHRR